MGVYTSVSIVPNAVLICIPRLRDSHTYTRQPFVYMSTDQCNSDLCHHKARSCLPSRVSSTRTTSPAPPRVSTPWPMMNPGEGVESRLLAYAREKESSKDAPIKLLSIFLFLTILRLFIRRTQQRRRRSKVDFIKHCPSLQYLPQQARAWRCGRSWLTVLSHKRGSSWCNLLSLRCREWGEEWDCRSRSFISEHGVTG